MNPIVIDFETDAIGPRPAYPPRPVGVAVKRPGRKARYLAWGHPAGNNCTQEDARRELAEHWANGASLLGHNQKFDLDVAAVHMSLPPPPPERVEDTMLLAFLDDPHSKQIGLKPLGERLLGRAPVERDALRDWVLENVPGARQAKARWGAHISKAPGDLVARYAADGDATVTEALWKLLRPKVKAAGMDGAYARERRLIPLLLDMERRGVHVDLPRLREDVERYGRELDRADRWIRTRLGVRELNVDSNDDLADAVEIAGKLRPEGWELTEKGNRSVSKENFALAVEDRALAAVVAYRSLLATCLGTFMRPWLETAEGSGGRIFTQWNSTAQPEGGGTRTGRFCIAKGGKILQPGKSTPIEKVCAGDLVYCYDDDLQLRIRKVIWSGKTGFKKVVKLSWIGDGRQHTGSLHLTADHPVRLVSGEYVEAGSLQRGDRVLAVKRSVRRGYNYLYWTHFGGMKECRVIYEELHKGDSPEHIHHADHDKLNDAPDNLVGMSAAEHLSHHTKVRLAEGWKPIVHTGDAHWNYKPCPQFEVIWTVFEENGFRSVKTSEQLGVDWGTFLRWAAELKLWDRPEVRMLKRRNGPAITELEVEEARAIHKQYGPYAAMQHIGVGWYRWIELQKFFGHSPIKSSRGTPRNNHMVLSVENCGYTEVYDLEVEDFHNFIAEELCVHNSATPNFQNIPTLDKMQEVEAALMKVRQVKFLPIPRVRGYIVAAPGKVLIGRDFSAQEPRMLAHFEDDLMCAAYREDPRMDVYVWMMEVLRQATGIILHPDAKKARKRMKTLVLAIIYGLGIGHLAERLESSVGEAQATRGAFLRTFPGIDELSKDLKRRARAGEPMRTWGGRVYYVEPSRVVAGRLREFGYKLINYLCQGSSADITKEAMLRYWEDGERAGDLVLTVHDELVAEVDDFMQKGEMAVLRRAMDEIPGIDVPMVSEGEWGRNWNDMEACA